MVVAVLEDLLSSPSEHHLYRIPVVRLFIITLKNLRLKSKPENFPASKTGVIFDNLWKST